MPSEFDLGETLIELIIYDLDNTLFDTYNQLSKRVLDDMVKRMKEVGLTAEQEKRLRSEYAYTGFKIIANKIGLNPKVVEIGMHAYLYMDLSHIKPFSDVKIIPTLPGKKVLVTSGVPEVQQKKIDILKIRNYFDEVVIDESSSPTNKEKIFKDLQKKYSLKHDEILIVGDNPGSELLAGVNLRIPTAQILRHEGMPLAKCDYHIKSLVELPSILAKYA